MDSKQDYFRSPVTKNMEYFCSPFRLLRHQSDPFLINNSLSPFNRNTNNYINNLTPLGETPQINEPPEKSKKESQIAKKISFVLPFNDDEEQQCQKSQKQYQAETPQKNVISITQVQTTARKKYDLRVQDPSEKIHINRDGERGLRALSKQAFQIFHNFQSMTYQQVAQKIIQQNEDLNQYPEVQINQKKKKKQRQSIKRRVYDALNVLIAVGILQKNGKKISLNRKRKEQKQRKIDTKKDLLIKIESKSRILETKRKRVMQLKNQKQNFEKIINRNLHEQIQNSKKINFPFVIGESVSEISKMKKIKIGGVVCGDADAIENLKFLKQKS